MYASLYYCSSECSSDLALSFVYGCIDDKHRICESQHRKSKERADIFEQMEIKS